jgi:hypothetical protein
MGHQMNFFFWRPTNLLLSVYAQMFFLNFQAAMGKRKINITFQLVSVKIVTKPIYSSEAA